MITIKEITTKILIPLKKILISSQKSLLTALVLMIITTLSYQINIPLNKTDTPKKIIITQNNKSENIHDRQEIDSAASVLWIHLKTLPF